MYEYFDLRIVRPMKQKSEIETQEIASGYYEEKRYREPHSRYYHDWWTSRLLSLVDVRGRILDNGCGTGILFQTLPESRYDIIGLDISAGMLRHARSRARRLVLGDGQNLPFPDGSFDLVIARSLLHHLPYPLIGLREMARILKKGGEMVAADTNSSLVSALPRLLAKRTRHFSEHHKNFTAAEIVEMAREVFAVDKIRFFGYLAYPLGFPDIMNLGRLVPRPLAVTKALTGLDEIISSIPLIRTQSWGIMIKGTRRD
jgi:ubiquinone/menaquinone biosynthesis C-methylase UbiE